LLQVIQRLIVLLGGEQRFFLKLIFSLAKNRHTLAWPTMIRRWASRPRISR
jgi:hypothetical protein